MSNKKVILDYLNDHQDQFQEIIAITVDFQGNYSFSSSIGYPQDQVYALEATKFQIMFNEYTPDKDQLN